MVRSTHDFIVEKKTNEVMTRVLEFYRDAFPRGSKGKSSEIRPAATNIVPEIHIGTDVVIFAYNAMMGACISGISLLLAFVIHPELAP